MYKLTSDEYRLLRELCDYRHKLHKSTIATTEVSFQIYCQKILEIFSQMSNLAIDTANISGLILELQEAYQNKEYSIFEKTKENINSDIEYYLLNIDELYNTKLSPEGNLRFYGKDIDIKFGMVFWCDRKINGYFNSDDEKVSKKIPALVISPDEWNNQNDSFQMLSIAKAEDCIKQNDYTVQFTMQGVNYIIRTFNMFTARAIHLEQYMYTLSEDILQKVKVQMRDYYNFPLEQSQEEMNVANTIERIMKEKAEKINKQILKENYLTTLQKINEQLIDLYPEITQSSKQESNIPIESTQEMNALSKNSFELQTQKRVYQKKAKVQNESQDAISPVTGKKKRSYQSWDEPRMRMFIQDYETVKNKQFLMDKYQFTSVTSLYTRYTRSKKQLHMV